MAARKTHCKYGHPRTPDNLVGSNNCKTCRTIALQKRKDVRAAVRVAKAKGASAESVAAITAPRKQNRRRYCMCMKCNHRWFDYPVKHYSDYYPPATDCFGYVVERERDNRVACPSCGSKHNVRFFQDVFINHAEASFPNVDPFDGRSLDEVAHI